MIVGMCDQVWKAPSVVFIKDSEGGIFGILKVWSVCVTAKNAEQVTEK